jgi:hypothetical protein
MARKKQQELPIRSSSHRSIPTRRKRAQSISTPPQPAKKAKKTKKKGLASLPPSPLAAQYADYVSIEDDEEEEVLEAEDEDKDGEVIVEAEDDDANTPPPPLIRFTSVWKAVTAGGREVLPSTKSAVFNVDNLFIFQLEAWRDQTLLNLSLRRFNVSQLQAVASYEKARQADCCP